MPLYRGTQLDSVEEVASIRYVPLVLEIAEYLINESVNVLDARGQPLYSCTET